MWSVINLAAHLPPSGLPVMCTCMFLCKVIVITLILHTPWVRLLEFIFWQLAGSAGEDSQAAKRFHICRCHEGICPPFARNGNLITDNQLCSAHHIAQAWFFFWYHWWVLGWWPSSVAALGSCGLSVPPAARLKWRNDCQFSFFKNLSNVMQFGRKIS